AGWGRPMSPQDLGPTDDVPGRKSAEDAAATTDLSRHGAATYTQATDAHIPQSLGATGPAGPRPAAASVPALPGYVIEGELGRGGMGVVYRGRHTELNRPVAIKMILGGKYSDPMVQARFHIEAEVIAAIHHPHVVQVFEYGRHDEQPYFVLEYV